MTNRGAVRPVGARPGDPVRPALATRVLLVALTVLAGFALTLPDATAAPAHPVPAATASPSASPTESTDGTPSASPSTTPRQSPRPDPEGDRWIELAVVGGGSLLGAVLMFMLIGGVIRWRNRRRYRD